MTPRVYDLLIWIQRYARCRLVIFLQIVELIRYSLQLNKPIRLCVVLKETGEPNGNLRGHMEDTQRPQ